jgi:hypothetical protein
MSDQLSGSGSGSGDPLRVTEALSSSVMELGYPFDIIAQLSFQMLTGNPVHEEGVIKSGRRWARMLVVCSVCKLTCSLPSLHSSRRTRLAVQEDRHC